MEYSCGQTRVILAHTFSKTTQTREHLYYMTALQSNLLYSDSSQEESPLALGLSPSHTPRKVQQEGTPQTTLTRLRNTKCIYCHRSSYLCHRQDYKTWGKKTGHALSLVSIQCSQPEKLQKIQCTSLKCYRLINIPGKSRCPS